MFVNRVRVLGSGPHTPTKFFWEYPPGLNAWNMKARGDLVLLQPLLLLLYKSKLLMLTNLLFNEESREVCIKARLLPALLALTDQITEHTSVKRPIVVFG